ncbi:hypothetical protein AAE478_004295 [Parahypoxylon ruwenzoriense]
MAGRRRRAASNSTVSTIDGTAIQYYKEDSVLKPVSARVHTDDWPCFLLTDATVYHRDGTMANLLHVDLEGPFIVRGRVEIEKDQEKFLVNRHMRDRSPWIQIQNTLSFSIGLKEDGLPMPVLWASGGAGWYEIVPSDAYKPICDTMFLGISLHYAVLDEYEAALEDLHKKKKSKHRTLGDVTLPLDDVLFKYAVTVGDGITLPEAYERTKSQAIFLLSHFPKGTQFHSWLAAEFPDIVQGLAAKESGSSKSAPISESNPLVAIPYSHLEQSSSFEVVDRKRKSKAPFATSSLRALRNSEAIDSEAINASSDEQSQDVNPTKTKRKSPLNPRSESTQSADVTMLDISGGAVYRDSNSAQNLSRTRHSLRVPTEDNARQPNSREEGRSDARAYLDANPSISTLLEALRDSRQDLVDLINEGRSKKHPDELSAKTWFGRLYLECSIKNIPAVGEACQYYVRDLIRFLGPEWHGSQLYAWAMGNADTRPTFDHITEEDIKRIVRRKKKPRPTREEPRATTEEKQAALRSGGKYPHRGRPSGKVASLRPPTGSKKRLRNEANLDEDEVEFNEDGLPKTSKKSRYYPSDDDNGEADDTTSSLSDGEQDEDKDVPLTRLVIRAEKLPSTTPKGPNQTWTCEEPDCGYVVRAADEEEGQALISEHYEAHEKDAQDEADQAALNRMNLAVKESQGHMPINNLLAKIRSLGNKAEKREEVQLNGQVLPQPIKRSLLA